MFEFEIEVWICGLVVLGLVFGWWVGGILRFCGIGGVGII